MGISDRKTVAERQREIRGGVYVVGFFDLLGQSNALKPYIDIRSEPQYIENLQRELTRLVDQLSVFRRDLTSYFEGALATKLTDAAPAGVTAEQLAVADDYQSPEIRIQGFSDTIVVYVPLATPMGQISLYGVSKLIVSVVNTMLFSFARDFAVRGAIDVSWGTEPFDGEFYGPALLSVYELECKIANWSRVVLGSGIQRLWEVTSHSAVESPIDAINVAFARHSSRVGPSASWTEQWPLITLAHQCLRC